MLFGLSLLPASRPAAHELPVCAALCEALLSQRPEGAGGADEPMADAASARDAVGAGGAAVPVAALAGVGEWQVGRPLAPRARVRMPSLRLFHLLLLRARTQPRFFKSLPSRAPRRPTARRSRWRR